MDVYGYCLDDPINFNDPLGLTTGGIWGNMPRRHNVKMWYIWKAGEGACKDCLAKNNNVFETPTMERPHPNCRCQQVECQTWDEFTKWEETKRLGNGPATMSQPVFPPGTTTVGVTWRRKIRIEEGRTVKHFRMMEGNIELLYSKSETRVVIKTEERDGTAHKVNTNYGIENGDSWWATNPWTGKTIGGSCG